VSALQDLLASPDRLLGRLRAQPPEMRALRRAVEALQGGDADPRRTEGTADLQRRVMLSVADGAVGTLSRRDLREGCKTLFHPPLAPGRDPVALEALFREVERRERRAAFLSLIGSYLDGFDPQDEDVRALAGRLENVRGTWPWRSHDPWPARAERFALFDPDLAPRRLGRFVIGGSAPADQMLAEAGLDTDGRRQGGLGVAAFRVACEEVETRKRGAVVAGQLRLLDWAFPRGRGRDLSLPDAWPDLAAAMFVPWADTPPEKDHQSLLSAYAIDYAGDPRTLPPKWRKVQDLRPDALHTLKRWLVRASVLQFFDIVDSVADERMWRYRRSFWASYVEAEHVDDAWIVFGAAGVSHARAVAERDGEAALRQFGRLEPGAGRSPNHACLLMTIGDLIIAEWSHNGRCYMWRRDTPKAPKLGQPRYYPDELAHSLSSIDGGQRIGIAHMQAESYGWQRRVAQHIADEIGVRTHQRDWKP
jgi:hypothetical protein